MPPEPAVHIPQEASCKHEENAAVPFPVLGFLVHGDMVVPRYEHAFAFAHMYLLSPIVQDHLPGINIVDGIFP